MSAAFCAIEYPDSDYSVTLVRYSAKKNQWTPRWGHQLDYYSTSFHVTSSLREMLPNFTIGPILQKHWP